MQNQNLVELRQVSKKYPFGGDFWALKEVFLEAQKGQIIGIIGRNGAGKTTLLNIAAGVLSPTQGKVSIRGRILGLFNLGVGFQDELTGRENIFLNGAILGATRAEIENKLSAIEGFSQLGSFIDLPLGAYSQGMRLRLGFSIIANLDFDILVIDEILAVGDMAFQNKCFEKLMDFKRAGKTLLVTNQSMDLIERLCDKVALLEHGELLFFGQTAEGIARYRRLLATEDFFVGRAEKKAAVFEQTKKWADDVSNWGRELGTREVVVDKVELKNRFGWNCSAIKSRAPLQIKVYFNALNDIREPHFGIAIFRSDGVYCYGPNTAFDGRRIPLLKKGKGYFYINYRSLLLAPGEYRISVAIWDKNEVVAFNYHNGCYPLKVLGDIPGGQLLNLPFKSCEKDIFYSLAGKNSLPPDLRAGELSGRLATFNQKREKKNVFFTNEPVTLVATVEEELRGKADYLWLGIFRDDAVCCQNICIALGKKSEYKFFFPKFSLLPGEYRLSGAIFSRNHVKKSFADYPLRMVFDRQDHGTVFLEHRWEWKLS